MISILRPAVALGTAALIAGGAAGATAFRTGSGEATLAVGETGGWVTWWRGRAVPHRWDGEAPLGDQVAWRPGAAGVEWGELRLRGTSEAWRTRVIVVRLDPSKVDLSLATAFTVNESWTVSDADSGAVLALDAGQFRHQLPWGWVVSQGREVLAPEYAPLAGAAVVDASGPFE